MSLRVFSAEMQRTFFNETISLEGAVPEEVYLEQVLKAAGEQAG